MSNRKKRIRYVYSVFCSYREGSVNYPLQDDFTNKRAAIKAARKEARDEDHVWCQVRRVPKVAYDNDDDLGLEWEPVFECGDDSK